MHMFECATGQGLSLRADVCVNWNEQTKAWSDVKRSCGERIDCLTARDNHGPTSWNKWVTQTMKRNSLDMWGQWLDQKYVDMQRGSTWTLYAVCMNLHRRFCNMSYWTLLGQCQVWDCRGATAKQAAVLWPQRHRKIWKDMERGKSHWRPL